MTETAEQATEQPVLPALLVDPALNEIVLSLLRAGCGVKLEYDATKQSFYIDLGFEMKSHGYLMMERGPDGYALHQRYDGVDYVNSLRDVLWVYKGWMLDAVQRWPSWEPSAGWEKLLVEHDMLEVKTVTTVTKSYR